MASTSSRSALRYPTAKLAIKDAGRYLCLTINCADVAFTATGSSRALLYPGNHGGLCRTSVDEGGRFAQSKTMGQHAE
jgi:hypothetical protein